LRQALCVLCLIGTFALLGAVVATFLVDIHEPQVSCPCCSEIGQKTLWFRSGTTRFWPSLLAEF
jgi:hypothetical protein